MPFVVFAATVLTLAWLGRSASPPPPVDRTVGGDTDAGRFFFLPDTQEAWAEVSHYAETSEDPAAGAWSHPLIGEALEDAVPTIRDGDSRLTYVEFCRVYAPRRGTRLEHGTTAHPERV
jgi:hypothetical protein